MFERISRSWELVKASWAVLRSDKELIVFPIVSSLVALVVMATFAIPFLVSGTFDTVREGREPDLGLGAYILIFLFYLVMYAVAYFFNTALVGAALIRLQGGDPTLSDGLRIASSRIGAIIGYALLSATVGVILRAIQERAGVVGQIVSGLFGLAWSVATFMVIPVLVVEEVGPVEAVKRSAGLLKKTWGEQIVGNFSIGSVFGLVILGIIILAAVLGGIAASADSTAGLVLIVVLAVGAVLVLSLISAALSGIFQAALYRYATGGDTAGYFDESLIRGAFRDKNTR